MKALTLAIFAVILALTLYITWWAAKRTRSTKDFYAAGRSVSAVQNGLALAGDRHAALSLGDGALRASQQGPAFDLIRRGARTR